MHKKRKKRKLNIKRIVTVLFILFFVIYLLTNNDKSAPENSILDISSIENNPLYKTIKLDYNSNYSGIGQERINDKDGYFSTFTTETKNQKTYIEYKQNGNSSWSNNPYWGGSMSENGCGITVMSIILSGYSKDYTPEMLREKYFPVMDYEQFSTELSSCFGIKNSGFYYDNLHLSNQNIIEHLNSNRPIIICVWNKPAENRWTTSSHYMALLATDNNGLIYVSNPNGGENDSKSSGWYNIDEVTPYIAKALYIESYK